MIRSLHLVVAAALLTAGPVLAAAPASVYIEDLTWTEVRAALHAGRTTALIPVGGTEQSGPLMALGKHNRRAQVLAGRIAQALGDALVAPVIAYVPEGSIDPPAGHMRFPGTISVPDGAFQAVLEGAARSLKRAGFTDIVLLGDHGGYQPQLRAVAARLDRAWAGSGVHAQHLAAYYDVTQTEYVAALRQHGLRTDQIGNHGGAADTALMLAVDPALVRPLAGPSPAAADGVSGDARAATAALGQLGVDLIVERSVADIRRSQAGHR